jgi:hypothetical protein
MSQTQQRPGDWRVICAKSGFKCWASETVMDPVSKMRVLRRFVDVQNPQDFLRAVPDRQAAPWTQPPGTDQFRSAIAVRPSDL